MTTGRTRSAASLYETPDLAARPGPVLNKSDVALEILEENGDWIKVREVTQAGHPAEGYLPRSSVAFPSQTIESLFPTLEAAGETLPAVPASAKMVDFNDWLNNGGRPAWIPDETWKLLPAARRQEIIDAVRDVKVDHAGELDGWELEVHRHFRRETARMGELDIFRSGGQDMLAVLPGYITLEPGADDLQIERAAAGDVLLWSGLLHQKPGDPGQLWYQVRIFKQDMQTDGWIAADLLDPYSFPTPDLDPSVPENACRAFDLTNPVLRLPDDPAVVNARANALATHWGGAQFIDVLPVTGHPIKSIDGQRHYKLCGEFCCATVAGVNIYDLLNKWMERRSDVADRVLTEHVGTSPYELRGILSMFDITGTTIDSWKSRDQLTPGRLHEMLASGKVAITGVRVGNVKQGRLDPDQPVDHWVVLEDLLPVGTSGWVRLYNPYLNQEEVYPYDTFMTCFWKFPCWTWVDNPKRPAPDG